MTFSKRIQARLTPDRQAQIMQDLARAMRELAPNVLPGTLEFRRIERDVAARVLYLAGVP